jgi:transcriptional regulator with XRE-family HTH domain
MGRATRPRPSRLAEKLVEIRKNLNLSQNGMIRCMGLENKLTQAEISAFERGIRQPPLHVLLGYARAAAGTRKSGQGGGDYLEMLVDDSLSLPRKLPGVRKKE